MADHDEIIPSRRYRMPDHDQVFYVRSIADGVVTYAPEGIEHTPVMTMQMAAFVASFSPDADEGSDA